MSQKIPLQFLVSKPKKSEIACPVNGVFGVLEMANSAIWFNLLCIDLVVFGLFVGRSKWNSQIWNGQQIRDFFAARKAQISLFNKKLH